MKRALLIGNHSTVGQAIAKLLEDLGWSVTTAGRNEADFFLDLGQPYCQPRGLESQDSVLLVAADFGGPSGADLERAEQVNAIGALNACRLASSIQANHAVIISTISATYSLGDPYYGAYSLSKRHGEELARLYCRNVDLPLAILRPTQIFSNDGACRRHQAFFYTAIDQAAAGKDVTVFGTHDARRNFLHLDDLAEIVVRVMEQRLNGDFDCPHPDSATLSEVAQTALSVFGRGGQVRFLSDHTDAPDVPECSGEELFRAVGFRPRISLLEGIRRIKAQWKAEQG